MESIIALEGDGFVLIAADVSSARSIVVMKDDMDKIRQLDDCKLFAAAGIPGDVTKFTEHVEMDVRLYTLRSGITMSTAAVANYTRGELARFCANPSQSILDHLKRTTISRSPFQCNVILGGYDSAPNDEGPSLYSCDYLGTLTKLTFAAEGYAQYFVLSTLDRYWKKNLSVDEGVAIIEKCINEIQKRFVVSQPKFAIKLVSKDGVRVIRSPNADAPTALADKADVSMTPVTAPVASAST